MVRIRSAAFRIPGIPFRKKLKHSIQRLEAIQTH